MICSNVHCKNEFIPKTKNQLYCSTDCRNRQGQRRFRSTHTKVCPKCGNQMKFDSKTCLDCSSKLPRGSKSDQTLAQLSSRRTYQLYSQIRQMARISLINYYKLHGIPVCCENCGYARHIEVCHIKPIASFDLQSKISEINHIDNLKPLCPNCHWEFDHP